MQRGIDRHRLRQVPHDLVEPVLRAALHAGKFRQPFRAAGKLITAMNPEYASFLTLRLYEGTPMYADVVEGGSSG